MANIHPDFLEEFSDCSLDELYFLLDTKKDMFKPEEQKAILSKIRALGGDYSFSEANRMPESVNITSDETATLITGMEESNDSEDDVPNKWVKFVRSIIYAQLAINIILVIIVGVYLSELFDSSVFGLIFIAGATLLCFLGAGIIMIYLNIADDVRVTRKAVEQVVKKCSSLQ